MGGDEGIGLYELQNRLREGLEELFPSKLWVRAEISSIQARSSGHCYLELSESDSDGRLVAKARAVIWRAKYGFLSAFFAEETGSELAAGISVLVCVSISYSELFGLTLVIDDIDPSYTLGEAEQARRRTLERLEADGLLTRQRALPSPELPYRLAVISAPDAAGFGDFCRHLDTNEYGFKFSVTLFDARMQGVDAPASITDALERIETSAEPFDAVLIIRGGGSALDLACFDDYGLCFSIASCPLPVYTAIGHDRDHHVADEVAHLSVKTPTALADEFIEAFAAEDERISAISQRLRLGLSALVGAHSSRVELLLERVRQSCAGKVALGAAKLDALENRINVMNPERVLERGYALVADGAGRLSGSVSAFSEGDRLDVVFPDGRLQCRVERKEVKNG